ncbi:MAG TPA: hypothetical protein PLQ61_05055 [Bacteroidales bacterium]|nr:hypothetical protein [Bacteroidales bacterium]
MIESGKNLKNLLLKVCFLVGLWGMIIMDINAQYFGQNKPSYKVFNYEVYRTPHFDIYHYLKNDSVLNMMAGRAEAWYRHHQSLFLDTIKEYNPLFIYENHAEFQQTTVISGMISESTGGVTEALKRRIVMPLFPSFPQTDHVLGHEMVHAFQFNMLTTADSLKLSNISNLPLWLVEGMAEYFSLGSIDPNTAMWMRDAVLSNDIPTIKDLTKGTKYFPYRYGQAVMAMIGKTWGDSSIVKLFRQTAIHGYEKAFLDVLGVDDKSFSTLWRIALINNYKSVLTDTTDPITGKKLIFSKNAGDMNLSPSISPDGKYVVFLSERDVYDFDLFLADAATGKIIKKLSNRIHKDEIDALSYLESSGTWSPDGSDFAFVVFSEGKNKLIIFNMKKLKVIKEVELPGLPSITNPSWSPDGKYIALTGMKDGVSDIYLYETDSERVIRLTTDSYSNMQPSWSPDGKYIAYVTDKPLPGQIFKFQHDFYNIGIVNTENPSDDRLLEMFTGARNMNPVFSSDGKSLYFLSDRDGFRNLYRYSFENDNIMQMTNYMRGITGITVNAPAISVALSTGDIVYSYYANRCYTIYSARPDEFKEIPVEKNRIDYTAGTIPPMIYAAQNLVDSSLFSPYDYFSDIKKDEYKTIPYRPKFKLDYITNGSIGVSTGGPIGTGMEGSISAIFSDMSGDNQLFTSLSLNGEIYDFGGEVAYLNQKKKLKWGASLSHIPNYYGFLTSGIDTLTTKKGEAFLVNTIDLNYLRMFEDKLGLYGYYPLSQTRRFEASAELSRYYYRFDQYKTYYDMFGVPIGSGREKLDAPEGFGLQTASVAFVTDNSLMGVNGPIRGTRYRIEGGKYFGTLDFYNVLLDYRKYFFIRPLTLAFRSLNTGRLGSGSESEMITPLYIGYPWLVRGYERTDQYWSDTQLSGKGISLENFFGSKMFIANVELRLPVSGPKNISLIKSGMFFTDLSLFFDGGLAMNKDSKLGSDWYNPAPGERVPIVSYGASLRFNLSGYLVIEPYYAVPVNKRAGLFNGNFGINFTPAW